MFPHIFFGVSDSDRAHDFHNAVLACVGLELRFSDRSRPRAGWQSPGESRPLFFIGKRFDENAPHRGNGQMVAFLANTQAPVDSTHTIALAHVGTCEGMPGLRPEYQFNDYGAYFCDLDGTSSVWPATFEALNV